MNEIHAQLEPLLTPEQVAGILGCSRKAVYVWAERGILAHVKLGRLVRFRPIDVEKLVESQRRGSPDLFGPRRSRSRRRSA
ncbi:MAG: helix-turn-helix domain-containing protein [Actinomycetota bacterium]